MENKLFGDAGDCAYEVKSRYITFHINKKVWVTAIEITVSYLKQVWHVDWHVCIRFAVGYVSYKFKCKMGWAIIGGISKAYDSVV